LYFAAGVSTAIILAILAGVKPLEEAYRDRNQTCRLRIEACAGADPRTAQGDAGDPERPDQTFSGQGARYRKSMISGSDQDVIEGYRSSGPEIRAMNGVTDVAIVSRAAAKSGMPPPEVAVGRGAPCRVT
jgi:hypothetical protein